MLTYAEFLLLFVLPPIVLLGAIVVPRLARPLAAAAGIALLVVLAMVYTTPWDNYLLGRGVWYYGENATLGRLWLAPIEEYAFFVLQTVLAGLWLHYLGCAPDPDTDGGTTGARLFGTFGWLSVAAVGAWLLAVSDPRGFYLGAIFLWAAPVAAFQWAVGGPVLWRYRRLVVTGVTIPTLYLSAIDRIAIDLGIWMLSSDHTTGLTVLGLPIEEGAFFLVTNVLVVQGLVLFHWVLARVRVGGVAYGFRGLLPTRRSADRPRRRDTTGSRQSEGRGRSTPAESTDRSSRDRWRS